MASDSAATYGVHGTPTIGQQECRKIHRIADDALFSSTGAVGISQIILDATARLVKDKRCNENAFSPEHLMDMLGKNILQVVGPYLQTATYQKQLIGDASASLCKTLFAFAYGKTPCLLQFDYNGAPERATEELPFIALGSGQNIADPFLAFLKRLLWHDKPPTMAEGRLVAVWTIDHVRRIHPGGVGGLIQLATLAQKDGKGPLVTTILPRDEIQEHLQRVRAAEEALIKELRGSVEGTDQAQPPKPPDK
jgi:hypothetical protein